MERLNHSFRISAYFAAIFGALGIYFIYYQIFLEESGLTLEEIGLIQATIPLLAIVSSPTWGVLADAQSDPRRVLRILVVMGPLSYLVLTFGRDFTTFLLLSGLLALFYQPILPVQDSLALRAVHLYGGDYGRMRIWGSLGFVVPGILLSYFWRPEVEGGFDWWMPASLYVGYSILTCIGAWHFPKVPPEKKPEFSLHAFSLFKNPLFVVLVASVFLSRWASASIEGYQAIYFREVGVAVPSIALYVSLGPLSEVVTIFYAQRWMARWGAYPMMALAIGALVCRLLIMALTQEVAVLVLIQLLHCLTFGLLYVVTVLTVNQLAGDAIRSSAQTIAVIFSNYLAKLSGLAASGWIAHRWGLSALFLASAGVAFVSLLLWISFFRDTRQTTLEGGVR